MTTLACVGLGSNLGDRAGHHRRGLVALGSAPGCRLLRVSPALETEPVGGPGGQGAYLNAAAVVETSLPAREFLGLLHAIEAGAGRTRQARWAERTLDLDLLLFGGEVLDDDAIQVPHPRLPFRKFVLAPLARIAPGATHPGLGRAVADLLANLDRRPGVLALPGWAAGEGVPLSSLRARLDGADWVATDPSAGEATPAPTFAALWPPLCDDPAAVGPGVPCLRVDSADLAGAVAEVLTACAAARSGGRWV